MVMLRPIAWPEAMRDLKDRCQFLPRQPARHAVIDSRHDGVIEHISIEVHPDPEELGSGQVLDGATGCFACAAFANLGEIDNRNRGVFDTLAAMRLGNLGVAAPECHDVLVPNQRTPTLKVGYNNRTAARGERKFHRCRLTVRLRLGLIEIGMTIEKQQPVTAAAPKGEQAAEHDRAIAAKNDGELPRVNHALDHVCECHRIVGNAPRVEKHRFRVAVMVILRRLNAPRAPRLQSLAKTLGQQSMRGASRRLSGTIRGRTGLR